MPFITKELIRKRAEHNEGIISTLEEISLHQEELESINETLGSTCRKLKILYLQNNIISKMENLHHMKQLEYLNMALNNIQKIEGLQNCEFLSKLDLTANFVDFDTLEESIQHLVPLVNLKILYMMGNPCQVNWTTTSNNNNGTTTISSLTTVSTTSATNNATNNSANYFESYVIAKLPQLRSLDGIEITKSMQIVANQKITLLEQELKLLAESKRQEKQKALVNIQAQSSLSNGVNTNNDTQIVVAEDVEDEVEEEEQLTANTPETRVKIYRELAEQKKEKDDRNRINEPRERHYENEQQVAVAETRQREETTDDIEIKQKNEGGWLFKWDEESKVGVVTLEVQISSFLDSSLIDVDVHPTYVSIIIKSKLLRLRLPAEVKVSESKCQRSKATGSLLIIMPKVNPKENAITVRADIKAKQQQSQQKAASLNNNNNNNSTNNTSSEPLLQAKSTTTYATNTTTTNLKTKFLPKKLSLQEELQQEYLKSTQSLINNNDKVSDDSRSIENPGTKKILISEITSANSSNDDDQNP